MNLTGKIELLAPAKNADIGIIAINHGANAVYIGAPQFSARAAAGNSIEDIARLVTYAHRYYTRVYVALNTILTETELTETEKLIVQLYEAGVDALIIQDMGILELNLPPISLHASTQCDNRTLEKVLFLEKCGFDQVVLARELSLQQIKTISENTHVALECFIHGALCVSYSGQCYASEALKGRSANRGVCAQICRLPFDLQDADGQLLIERKHLLSLKDFDASAHLQALVNAGVSSFKIEGRLKDADYVKNITAFYRQQLDAVLEKSPYSKSSSGNLRFFFEPNPQKTFNRGTDDYFLTKRKQNLVSMDTPKSIGEPIGKLKAVTSNYLIIENAEKLHNGDGLCCLDKTGEWIGFRSNRVENSKIFPLRVPPLLATDVMIYRNFDTEFCSLVTRTTSERKIRISIAIHDTTNGFSLCATDEDGNNVQKEVICEKVAANNIEKAIETFRSQFSKLGNTIFELSDFQLETDKIWFVPVSQIAEWRRDLTATLENMRQNNYSSPKREWQPTYHPFPEKKIAYNGNIFNCKAQQFYRQHGVESMDPAFETTHQKDVPIMHTKYCVKYNLGWCPKQHEPLANIKEPLFLVTGTHKLRLHFDCKHCEMFVFNVTE